MLELTILPLLPGLTLGAAGGNSGIHVILFLLLVILGIWLVKGFYVVPIGARGLVIQMGRRTGEVRSEGFTWLPAGFSRLDVIYVRERQIDVPATQYYTQDRARISFKTTLRVSVSDPGSLFDQGPGTYAPFTREGKEDRNVGSEEGSVVLDKLMKNAIREAVRSLSIHEVMFGPQGESVLQSRILDRLSRTARRWGLAVHEIWLTEVETSDQELSRAVQSEVQQSMEGRGELASHRAEIEKSTLYVQVARQMVESFAEAGRSLSLENAMKHLQSHYQNERELDIALQRASNVQELVHDFMIRSDGLPWPIAPRSPGLPAAATEKHIGPEQRAQWIIGRDGHIVVEGDGVSRRHAKLELYQNRMTLTDLGSTNGTFIGDQRLEPNVPTPVPENASVRLGKHVVLTRQDLLSTTKHAR